MAPTGRSPYETSDVVPYGAGERRLRLPAGLGEAEKAAFLDLVTSTDPKQFRAADLPLLARWSELCVMAEKAAKALASEGMVIDGRASPWIGIHQMATKNLSVLALRLRLGPQSRMARTPKAIPLGWLLRAHESGEPR